MTVSKIGEVVEEDTELKRFMLPVEQHARDNGLVWHEVGLKSALGGGAGGGQIATALLRIAEEETEELIEKGGYLCTCSRMFAYEQHRDGHEKKHKKEEEKKKKRGESWTLCPDGGSRLGG